MTVTVYSQPSCMSCKLTKRHLEKLGIDFHEGDIDDIVHIAKANGITSAPVVQIDGKVAWGGYRPDKIDALVG